MRAVMVDVPEHILEWRQRTGADRWDEMWEGVLHMAPLPTREHQEIEFALLAWLRRWWAPATGGRAWHQINVTRPGLGRRWIDDYRVPDLVLALPEAFARIDRNTHFDGGPDAVVEIRTPGDETDDKVPFYAAVGCREIWIVERDSREVQVRRLEGDTVEIVRPATDGWLHSGLGVQLRTEGRRVALRLSNDSESLGHAP